MLKGELVRLREYREEDIKPAQEYVNHPETVSTLVFTTPFPYTLNDEKKAIEQISAFKDNYYFAIESLEGGRYIGGCGIKELDWKNSRLEVGIFIGDIKLRGKGYGTDAMKVLVGFIFNEMNINKIKLQVLGHNKGAIRSYEKAGFKEEGLLKREVYRQGGYRDIVVMAIFKDEYFRVSEKS